MRRLTGKKRSFIDGVLGGLKPIESAKLAGYAYPRQSSRYLLQDSQVQFYLKRAGYSADNIEGIDAEKVKDVKNKLIILTDEQISKIIQNSNDPKLFLIQFLNNDLVDKETQVRIAAKLLPFYHAKKPPIKRFV